MTISQSIGLGFEAVGATLKAQELKLQQIQDAINAAPSQTPLTHEYLVFGDTSSPPGVYQLTLEDKIKTIEIRTDGFDLVIPSVSLFDALKTEVILNFTSLGCKIIGSDGYTILKVPARSTVTLVSGIGAWMFNVSPLDPKKVSIPMISSNTTSSAIVNIARIDADRFLFAQNVNGDINCRILKINDVDDSMELGPILTLSGYGKQHITCTVLTDGLMGVVGWTNYYEGRKLQVIAVTFDNLTVSTIGSLQFLTSSETIGPNIEAIDSGAFLLVWGNKQTTPSVANTTRAMVVKVDVNGAFTFTEPGIQLYNDNMTSQGGASIIRNTPTQFVVAIAFGNGNGRCGVLNINLGVNYEITLANFSLFPATVAGNIVSIVKTKTNEFAAVYCGNSTAGYIHTFRFTGTTWIHGRQIIYDSEPVTSHYLVSFENGIYGIFYNEKTITKRNACKIISIDNLGINFLNHFSVTDQVVSHPIFAISCKKNKVISSYYNATLSASAIQYVKI